MQSLKEKVSAQDPHDQVLRPKEVYLSQKDRRQELRDKHRRQTITERRRGTRKGWETLFQRDKRLPLDREEIHGTQVV